MMKANRLNRPRQISLPLIDLSAATEDFARGGARERGAVFTRPEVVEFILDLAGYTVDRPLHLTRLLEPSFGGGDFLLPAVQRLLTAYKSCVSDRSRVLEDLSDAVRAVEVHRGSIRETSARLLDILRMHGVAEKQACGLIEAWLIEGDFLLVDLPHTFTHALGNPPYVRQEEIPDLLMAEYRARYATIFDRADLYVPFIERCLNSLEPGGTLGFICSDRWMKNKYGGPLRALVAGDHHLVFHVDMVDTPAFRSDVIAYPAITVIRREESGPTRIAHRPRIDEGGLVNLAQTMCAEALPEMSQVTEVEGIVNGGEPWILSSFDELAIVRRLEESFPTLEEAGCSVGIGVATGADRVYIGTSESLDVEPDRKLPLVKTRDIQGGSVRWQGLWVINPFRDDGTLVNLTDYPRLARYFERHLDTIRKRNCARKNPNRWYRTIDRIYPELARRPKLLIPDIKGEAHVVFEEGRFYPHHNLYYITSEEWDLAALQAILQSGIAKLFVSVYSTQMRGGYLRFQAQYLRRIRIPRWESVPHGTRRSLVEAARAGDFETRNRAVYDLYRLTRKERSAMG